MSMPTPPGEGYDEHRRTIMTTLKVKGMTCGHCEAGVRSALESVAGVTAVTRVDREAEVAEVEGTAAVEALIAAVVEEGYEAEAA